MRITLFARSQRDGSTHLTAMIVRKEENITRSRIEYAEKSSGAIIPTKRDKEVKRSLNHRTRCALILNEIRYPSVFPITSFSPSKYLPTRTKVTYTKRASEQVRTKAYQGYQERALPFSSKAARKRCFMQSLLTAR